MKETVGSLKAYLLIAGTLGLLTQLGQVADRALPDIARVVAVLGCLVSGSYIYIGARLRRSLETRSAVPRQVLLGGALYAIGIPLLLLARQAMIDTPPHDLSPATARAGGSLFTLLLTAYILNNLARLSTEGSQG